MMTYEMVGVADQNNRTYESRYGTYNKKSGFVLKSSKNKYSIEELIYKLFHENCWSLKLNPRIMTK